MGFFGKLFDKKECSVCGGEIGLFGNRKLEDGKVQELRRQALSLVQRPPPEHGFGDPAAAGLPGSEPRKSRFVSHHPHLGERTKVMLDEDAGLFMVTSARDLTEANPDVLSFSDVTGCRLDIDESKTEIEYRDANGNRQSFNPPRYAYSYDFYIVINVNHPYFNEIRFQLNSESVDNDEETLLDGPNAMRSLRDGFRPNAGAMRGSSLTSNREEVRASVEYRQYEAMGFEIRDALLQVRQQVREEVIAAAAPKTAVTCPFCGATTTPDVNGCCEFCGGAVNS